VEKLRKISLDWTGERIYEGIHTKQGLPRLYP
jgi:hypothetical protein